MAAIDDFIQANEFDKVKSELIRKPNFFEEKIEPEEIIGQYETMTHKIMKKSDKLITTTDEQGTESKSSVPVSKLAIPFQKLIVARIVSFLANNGIKIQSTPSDTKQSTVLQMINRLLDGNKMDYQTRKVLRILFSEREVAELWFFAEDAEYWLSVKGVESSMFKMRMKILANSLGDKLWPHFDIYGDMDVFSREYTVQESASKTTTRFDVYTADFIYKYVSNEGKWGLDSDPLLKSNPASNLLKKIPVIYYAQAYTEWHDVQTLIDRYEETLSSFSDTIDYNGSPIIFIEGAIKGFSAKGERGKVIEGEPGTKASYLSWQQAPEAIKLELETLEKQIYTMTQTPPISFSEMKSIGGTLSGVAIQMLFMDAHLKCFNKQEIVGEGIQRRLNLLKSAIANVIAVSFKPSADSLSVKPEFKFFLPVNKKEESENLLLLTGNKPVLSQQTAVNNAPYVDDAAAEYARIQEEEKASANLANSFIP